MVMKENTQCSYPVREVIIFWFEKNVTFSLSHVTGLEKKKYALFFCDVMEL
ncbi:hypothetical protein [Staphylococcus aureus]|uniref:hypothetical protein n=1 Tax=Staphylococcus aureus TaxID=1280 RepID=UPI003364F619